MINNNEIENKKHIETVYKEKAENLIKICIAVYILSGISYFFAAYIYKAFDFGLIFELVSFIFAVIILVNIKNNKLESAKRNTIIAMIPIAWIIIYDFIELITNLGEVIREITIYYLSFDQYFYYIEPYLYDVRAVLIIILLYKVYVSLCKIDGSKVNNSYTDSFFDNL